MQGVWDPRVAGAGAARARAAGRAGRRRGEGGQWYISGDGGFVGLVRGWGWLAEGGGQGSGCQARTRQWARAKQCVAATKFCVVVRKGGSGGYATNICADVAAQACAAAAKRGGGARGRMGRHGKGGGRVGWGGVGSGSRGSST